MIWISSAPSGYEVYVDQVKVGVTPLQSPGLQSGVHQVRVTASGYHEWVGYVQINSGTFTYIPKVILERSIFFVFSDPIWCFFSQVIKPAAFRAGTY